MGVSLICSLIFGSIGLGYFLYGKKQAELIFLAAGLGLMIFPYFVANVWALLAIGGALLATPHLIRLS